MHNTELYLPSDEELVREQTACLERLYDFNQTRPGEMEKPHCHAKGDVCIEFRVSSTFEHSRSVSDKPPDVSGNGGILRSLTAVTVTVVHLWPASLSWTKPA